MHTCSVLWGRSLYLQIFITPAGVDVDTMRIVLEQVVFDAGSTPA